MPPSLSAVLQFSLIALTSIFFLVDPIAVIPSFLVITADAEEPRRRKMARRAAWTCFVVLSCFSLAGSLIFKLFGITLPAFKIAGGIILILIGLDMLQPAAPRRRRRPTRPWKARRRRMRASFRWVCRCSPAQVPSQP
jgi:small neutral amino acid transporter SnatA (MarC family)